MQKKYTLITLTLLLSYMLIQTAIAQSPEKMSFQAVVRDADNNLVINKAVGMQLSILQTSVSGTEVYKETQTPSTNSNGLLTLEIGTGDVVTGVFTTIDWSKGPYFIKTETDPTGGTNYTITGVSQLLSVPYALHAKTAEKIIGGETDPIFNSSVAKNITTADIDKWNVTNTNTPLSESQVDDFVANNGYLTAEIDGSVTNEIQNISRTGTTVTLTNGGSYQDSVNTYTAGTGIDITNNVISASGSTSSTCGLSIGDTYQGGIIFYLDASGCHGLISAATDQSTGGIPYGNTVLTNSFNSGIGDGFGNTFNIINTYTNIGTYAAKLCNDLNLNSYTDWYLPSI